MSWVNVGASDLNEQDIFAFVNMQENVVLKGRLVTLSDCSKAIATMDDSGAVYDIKKLPAWATIQPEEIVLRAVFDAIGKLPGTDLKNKVFNIQHNNYTEEQIGEVMRDVLTISTVTPSVVILKYIPDLTITAEMMKEFQY